jgi:hypothetical protein
MQQLNKHATLYDEAALFRPLLEVSLLDSAYQPPHRNGDDELLNAAKRYRVDTEKIQKAVAREFSAKRKKQEQKAVRNRVST